MTVPGFETLVIESPGAGAGLLAPGRIQRALALGAGVRAEEIGLLVPLGRGRVAVDIHVQRTAALATPRYLPFSDAAAPALMVLRREDDPEQEGQVWLDLSWSAAGGAAPPSPGAVCAALAQATGGAVGAEAVGASFCGAGWMRLEVTDRFVLALALPMDLKVGERTVRISDRSAAGDDGKKKP